MIQFDTESLYQFLTTTPEKGLRSMLIDAQFTESHFNILMKVVRGATLEQFDGFFTKRDFPKVKFNDKENKIKPKFWHECEACLNSRGLLTVASTKKVDKVAA